MNGSMGRARPVVGVCADRKMVGAHPAHVVGEKYLTALVDGALALAIVLPALGERQRIDELLALVDGLLLTGSYSNVEPARYGGPASAPGTLHDAARDATALPLVRAAIDAGVPVLAICRGMQELNVAFGGTLHQQVHGIDGHADHREDAHAALDVQYGPAHAVQLAPGGLLQRLMHGADSVEVNSLHAQGIERLGEGLTVEARAPDGLIEAIGVRDARAFALGVQWHPEWRFEHHALSKEIFAAFGAACHARMRRTAERAARVMGA
ncbi:gamma-glutamyl-gamma-aminobutyrate hydrolase family protein [Burkholderia singularis]|uniref:gamma-glutamyl-gamma-aminobutyrate hydrolase n=1 Tax=Burkholderia singularis TaxID=1503053 RepID=A0A238HC47_9BURK|nr:gamma-glutamyl-gamma-aminobutyrate hydrolase family protein [Burkholderia singularis]SMG03161.1 Gamma-glutamyl-GABA hydrolase [Burkholderia singularis]